MDERTKERLELATRGDADAVEALLAQFLPGLHAFVRLRAGPQLLAQESSSDLVQSACRDVLENLELFEHGGPEGFKRWLYRTALRKIADRYEYYRAAKRDVGRVGAQPGDPAPVAEDPTASQEAIAQETVEQLETALQSLSAEHREVIVLARQVGLSHAEIAAEMGRSEVAARSLLSRALASLAERLDDVPPAS